MTPTIRIEQHPADFAGISIGAVHLYLVYQGENGDEYVLRSGPRHAAQLFGGEMKIEANVPIEASPDARHNQTPAERSSTEVLLPGTADAAWAIMVKYARMLDAADYGYNVLEENSNTFIAAMIKAAGGTPATSLPTGIGTDQAIGYSTWGHIIGDVAPPANGTIYGTPSGDTLRGMQISDVIRALGGPDVVRAGAGADRVYGGAGADRLSGQEGDDRLYGQSGNDRLWGGSGDDVIWGGKGSDRLTGGPGDDRLIGGPGPDVFAFRDGDGADRVDGFSPGEDRLRIQAAGVAGFDDLDLSRTGASGADLLVAFGEVSITLRQVDLDAFGPADVQIVPPDDLMA